MADSPMIQPAPSTEEQEQEHEHEHEPTPAPAPAVTLKVEQQADEVSAVDTHISDNSKQQQQRLTDQQQQQPEQSITKLPPPISFGSFKEESNKAVDLRDSEKIALDDLKNLVQIALDNHEFTFPPQQQKQALESEEATSSKVPGEEEVSIWGVPLLQDERTDAILLKFLRARDFKVKETFTMIKNTLRWRQENNIDSLVNDNNEDAEDDLEKVVFMHGFDKEGHPVCYNVYGEFQDKDLYQKLFSDEAKRRKFLKQRVMFLERSIRKLDFSPGAICTIFQVNDLKNAPGPGKRELRIATKQALQLLQDNYPEFVAKQVFINVPWWYLAFYTIMSPFLTQRTKSKFVFAGPSRSAETLLKYIPPEQLPVQFGGLSVDSCDCNPEFSMDDLAVEVNVKPGTKQIVEIIIYEKCMLVWELRVVGWEVTYGAEFVPNAKDGYTMIVQKAAKIGSTDSPVVHNSFKVTELGKVLLTVGNPTSKSKKLLYRYYVKPISEK